MEKIFDNNIDKHLEKLCRKSKVVGTNVALFNNEKILYEFNYGYANKASNLKSTKDSLYMIGSNTKVMTALGILKMLENNELSIEDDITKYIPEFQVKSNFKYDKITIENLLMHRSGLTSDLFNLILDPLRDYHEVIEELKDTYLTSVPGQMFSYSNVGYTLLGIIIERISGLSYSEYIKKIIAKPLGIQIHFLKNNEEKKTFSSNISLCYNKKGESVEDRVTTMIPAGSSTYMSLKDFVKFGQIFLNKDNTIFKKETLELMETLNVKEEIDKELMNVGYGLIHNHYNFGETVGKVLGHGGNTTYHHSIFNYIPSLNVGVAVVTNSEQAAGLSQTLGVSILTEYLKKKGLINGDLSLEHKHTQASCEAYPGKFATTVGLLDITKNKNGELVTKVSKYSAKLIPCEDGFLQSYPNNLLLQLPPLKKAIKGLRLKLINYGGKEVMIVEQSAKNHKYTGIIGCRYEKTAIPQSFREACGNYEITDDSFKNLNYKCALSIENGMLKLELQALNTKMTSYLKVIDDNLAYVQGFGRNAGQVVQIGKDEDGVWMKAYGVKVRREEF